MSRLVSIIDRWRFRCLLAMLVLAILVQPLTQHVTWGGELMILWFAAIFAAAFRVTHTARSFSWLGTALAVLWAIVSLMALFDALSGSKTAALMVTILLSALVSWRILELLLLEQQADRDSLAGAIFGYLLLAVLWGEIYSAIEIWAPGSFSLSENAELGSEMLYFSLVTITTLGYGDVLPQAPFARILAGTEAAVGTLYIAILIGRIVGALKAPTR